MVLRPTLSIVTGDSNALVCVRVADTTISSDKDEADITSISSTSVGDFTTISWLTAPTPDTTKVKGYFTLDGTARVKFPLSSVVVPVVVPLIWTDSLFKLTPEVFLTLPEMDEVCARTTVEIKAKTREAKTLATRFISSYLGSKFVTK